MMDLAENEEGQHLIQHCVIIQRDEKGYGLTVTGDNPVYVQSVKEGGAAHRTGVQVGDKIVKVNGTDVREFNHIEVVNLIKSGSYVALTLLGKPPSHAQADRQHERPPQLPVPRDPVMDERTVTIQRVLDQEKQFYRKTLDEYTRRPTENLQRELAESTTRIKAFEAELHAQRLPVSSKNGPFSAPPGKTVSPTWQQVNRFPARCNSVPSADNTSPPPDHDPNALYDNYPPAVISPGISDSREVPSSPPQPPMRKIPQKGDQFMPLSGIASGTYPGKKRHKKVSLTDGPTHVRQHSSPESFFRPAMNGSSSEKSLPVRNNNKKKSFDDGSGLSWKPGYPAAKAHKNPLTASLPKAWKPIGQDNKGILMDNVSSKSSSSGNSSPPPPPTPTLTEPLEKKLRNDAADIYIDEDEESSYNTIEISKGNDSQNDPIMSMEDEEFASDDEKIDDHGPFNDLEVLKNKAAHMAVFLHYLISNCDPSSLFFWMVTDTYREGTLKEMKKWAYEIYSTFLDERAPLKVDNMDKETVIEPIVSCLRSEEITKDLFQHARTFAEAEIKELLQDFRNKRALGLGSLFGDHQLEDDNMDKGKELQVVEQTLMPHLEEILAELETNTDASQVNRNNAMVSALTTFLRQVGITMKQQGNNANILERYQSFTRKENKPLFKMKSNKKMKGHHFVSTQYTTPTYCNHCGYLLWGAGDQGYQCSTCEYNVHKGSCFETIEECPGTKKKRERKPTIQTGRSPSFANNSKKISQPVGPSPFGGKNWNPENDDENESDTGNTEHNKKKSGSFDEDLISGGRDRGMTADDLSREGFIGSGEEGMLKIKSSTSELFLDKPHLPKVGRSESMKTPREFSNKIMNMRIRKSVAGPVDSVGVDPPTMDVLSEDGRRARSRSPSFLPPEEEPDPDMEVDAQPTPWQQVIDKKTLRKLKGKEIKRQEFIHELIYTERTHVRNLKVLSKVFYKPMIKMNIMPYTQIHQLFPNLDALIQLHVSLMQSMMARQEESDEVITCIGDVMLDRFDGEPGEQAKEACAQFCNHQKFALEQLKHRQRKDLKLQQFIVNCENDPLCRRLRLQDIISNSYQRLTKYPMLLEGIQKNTPSSHEDGRSIERAIQCTKNLLAYVNQSVKECEDQQRLADFQRKIDRRPLENTNNKLMEEFKNLDLTQKKLVYDGPLTWRINRTKCVDLHVLLLEDLLILLQKQDEKLVLKCLSSTFQAGYLNEKTTHSPIIKLSSVLTRNVATDKRAFFLVSTSSSVGPQIYELVTATVTDRKNWYKYITDAVEAFKIKERGRRNAVSVEGVRQPVSELDLAELPSRRVNNQAKEEPAKEQKPREEDVKAEEEDREKETDADDDFSDPGDDDEEDRTQNQDEDDDEDEETESEAPVTQEEVAVPKINEPTGRQESQLESESEPDSEPETETEVSEKDVKEQVQIQSESPVKIQMATVESSPPSDSETDVLSAEDGEAAGSSLFNRAAVADLTNEESVDERSLLERNRNSVTSESSSSSSNDTLKIRRSYVHISADEQDESVGGNPSRSSAVLLELLRSKDNDLRKIIEEKSRLVAELRGANMTMGSATNESHVNGDSVEARDLILAAILQANRLTVAVSDVLNPNIDDMSRGVGHLGYGGIQGDFSPQQQLVSSTSVLNEQLTTLLGVITDRDMVRDRLRCDLQLANSQIQRLKQGRSSSRRTRELPGSQFAVNDDSFSGGFHSDSPRPSSPTSTIDFDSDYARLSETSDYLASEDNMDSGGRSSSMSGFRNRSSLASSGYRSSTASSRHLSRSRDEATTHWRQGRNLTNNRAYWSDDGAEYESQAQI
ncbi:rho guanine nucleotide exchange factor 11 isoform X2 [Pocillopora verrucosa]|uniref:rho guanine nucleotide exchange factor 11 isoform X2 n=1 Tax=Pocillopora verrucosa TaxID=203993 RepID=UPI00333FDB5C